MNETTRELLDEYFELAWYESQEELDEEGRKAMARDKSQIEMKLLQKVENIHHVIVSQKETVEQAKARQKVYQEEADRLRARVKSMESAWKRMKWLIMQIVEVQGKENQSGNMQLKTDLATYTVVPVWGALEMLTEPPDEFISLVEKVDNRAIRQTVIDAGGKTEYGVCERKPTLRIR